MENGVPGGGLRVERRYFGWYVVFACFCMALFGWGLGFYGLGIYLTEVQRARGWSASLISGAATGYYLVSGALVIYAGEVIGRFGSRRVVLAGMVALGLGACAITVAATPWQLYLAYLLMTPGWAGLTTTAIATTLAPWFVRRRGLAISLALNGASCGGIVIVPALVALVERFGFATAVRAVVLVMFCVLGPITIFVLGRTPHDTDTGGERTELGPGTHVGDDSAAWTRRGALRDVGFWTVAIPFALGLLAQVGFLTHQIAFLRPSLGAGRAGLAVGVTTTMAVIGRVGLGFFIDRLPQRTVTAALLTLQAAALALMIATRDSRALFVACAGFGFAVGNLITLPSLIVQREYGATSFGLILGLVTAIAQFTYAFGPGLVGVVRDASGGYEAALGLCAALELAGAAIVLARVRPR